MNLPERPISGRLRQGRVVVDRPRAASAGLLTAVDLGPFAAYCQACADWRTAREVLAAMAERDPATHGLLVKRVDGNAAQNPLVMIAANAASDMPRYAGEFVLTPLARAHRLRRLRAADPGQV